MSAYCKTTGCCRMKSVGDRCKPCQNAYIEILLEEKSIIPQAEYKDVWVVTTGQSYQTTSDEPWECIEGVYGTEEKAIAAIENNHRDIGNKQWDKKDPKHWTADEFYIRMELWVCVT